MNDTDLRNHWYTKFRNAFRGLKLGTRGESSFLVHFFFGAAVLIVAAAMQIADLRQWCLLVLCIAIVLSAELFNSALERMARAISEQHDPNLGAALDIGSAAVLVVAAGAAVVGVIVFLARLGELLAWW